MKKEFFLSVLILLVISVNVSNSRFVLQYRILEPNNIRSFFWSSGIFDQAATTSSPGFEWPKNSNKNAIFSAGLNLIGRYNGNYRMAACTYKGEYVPGYCNNGIPVTNSNFRFYKVSRGDNIYTNPDWESWVLIVPFGAPYVDVNHNGIYEPAIDTPGVRNSASTIFICITDGFWDTHSASEGFGGGTLPLFAEIHMTAWAYTQPSYSDMQFIKYEIINKGNVPWTNAYVSIISDPNLGFGGDDYIACDTIRKLGICYNADNDDEIYGINPPAVGIMFLKGIVNKSVFPNVDLKMSSFCNLSNPAIPLVSCESGGTGNPYLFIKGFKNDSSSWLDVTHPFNGNHYKKTKFCYYGDPETSAGWTEYKGKINNCDFGLNDTGIVIFPNPTFDRRMIMSSGAENFTFNVGDTQTVYLCQLIARGTSNLNSVTKLKQLADVAQNFYNSGFTIGVKQISSVVPDKFELFQNYPNPFNPITSIKFKVASSKFIKLVVYDILGKEVAILVNEKLQPGEYEIQFPNEQLTNIQLQSSVYFYSLFTNEKLIVTKKMVLLK